MANKILIPISADEIAPRFDLAGEVHIITRMKSGEIESKTIVLPSASAEKLCHMILTESINTLICGAIEDEYYQFLKWKKIRIFDSVAGPWSDAFERLLENNLKSGDILCKREVEGSHVEHS